MRNTTRPCPDTGRLLNESGMSLLLSSFVASLFVNSLQLTRFALHELFGISFLPTERLRIKFVPLFLRCFERADPDKIKILFLPLVYAYYDIDFPGLEFVHRLIPKLFYQRHQVPFLKRSRCLEGLRSFCVHTEIVAQDRSPSG